MNQETYVNITELSVPRSPAYGTAEHAASGDESPDAGSTEPVSKSHEPTAGNAYTWQDGDRLLPAFFDPNLIVQPSTGTVSQAGDTADSENAAAVRDDAQAAAPGGSETVDSAPVFRSESGELMTLPGGVALILDSTWDLADTNQFFAHHAIESNRVTELDYVTNGYFIETEPGFPSLELANFLATQDGVELSSPNWLIERDTE